MRYVNTVILQFGITNQMKNWLKQRDEVVSCDLDLQLQKKNVAIDTMLLAISKD